MLRVEDYILNLPEGKRDIYLIVREIIHESLPNVSEKIAYGLPFFYLKKPFCYLHQHEGGVDVSFMNGNFLLDQYGVLEKRDRKRVRSLHYKDVNDIQINILRDTILEAAQFDPSMKK